MSGLHALLAWVALAATLLVLVVATAGALGRVVGRRAIDRAILVAVPAVLLAVLAGATLPLTVGPPRDLLHFVYAAVALGAIPVARAMAGPADSVRVGRYVAVGAVVVLGAMLRLFMTGR